MFSHQKAATAEGYLTPPRLPHHVVTLPGPKLDLTLKTLAEILVAPSYEDLVLDLGAVEFPTAAGVGQLVRLQSRAKALGRRVVLTNVQPIVYEVFVVCRVVELVRMCPA